MARLAKDGADNLQIKMTFFAPALTILASASLREVEKDEGPAGGQGNACAQWNWCAFRA